VRAAGVRRHVAADLRLLGRTGVGREPEAAPARDPAQLGGRHARLGLDPPEQRVEAPHPRHPLGAEDDAALRNGPAREAGAAPAGRDRDAARIAVGDDGGDLGGRAGQRDEVGPPLQAAPGRAVAEVRARRRRADVVGADDRRQRLVMPSAVHACHHVRR
jgi:hypothetical protein